MKRARTDTFEHTISGLLTKRADLKGEAQSIRDRLAEIRHDIEAVDRVLGTLGYDGDLDAVATRAKREVMFGRGELTRAIMDHLRTTTEPVASRDIAREIVALRGDDARDRKYLSDLTKRVSKALRALKADGRVTSRADQRGNLAWAHCI